MGGVLQGIRILEFAAIGPVPFCGMMLADHGAEVILAHRPGTVPDSRDPHNRSRTLVEIDIKSDAGRQQAIALARSCDGVIEGFRPGVMERVGLGPDVLLQENPRLVYGRMTGWGQTGPLAPTAGHDINYIAMSGSLHASGRAGEKPTPAANMVGDFGGGGMMLSFGMVAGLLHAARTGEGQVVDCAMTDGSALLMSLIWGMRHTSEWEDVRGVNLLDTGAPFYDTYETSDGRHIALGALEPQFYAKFLELTGLAGDADFDTPTDRSRWPGMKEKVTATFLTRTRAEWTAIFDGHDACFAPVLSMDEARDHPHNRARGTFINLNGVDQPAPAPRFSRTPALAPRLAQKG